MNLVRDFLKLILLKTLKDAQFMFFGVPSNKLFCIHNIKYVVGVWMAVFLKELFLLI